MHNNGGEENKLGYLTYFMRVLLLGNLNQVGMKNDNSQSWCEGKNDRKEGKIREKEEFRADESRVKHQGMIKCNITMAIKQN